MKRTIKETFANRLAVQKKEADVRGLEKVANNLNYVCENTSVRADNSSYMYLEQDMLSDVEKPLWDAVVRIADYYDCNIDAETMQNVIEKAASSLMKEVRIKGGVKHGVGAYEPVVPGETPERVTIEIESDE